MFQIRKFFLCGLLTLFLLSFQSQASAVNLPITSHFGWRIHPITGEYKFHSGLDLGYDYGTVVGALFSGIIVAAGDYLDGYGKQVLIYHSENNTYTRYAHLQKVYVNVDSYVNQGDAIGEVGSTGNSTGPHLHLEYIVFNGTQYEYANPLILWE
ncbi:MAG: M23 family metallopeptidase [Selenomonadaceae bacterium]|nr:M23 family metallopeptidase [Selenomonadaceae bacterium]